MSKVFKKMKLNELQKENLVSKEMKKLVGGDKVCGCAGSCLGSTCEDSYVSGLAQGKYSC